MKKSRLQDETYSLLNFCRFNNLPHKIMVAVLLIAFSSIQLQASDTTIEKISIEKQAASLKEVLKDIEKQSKFRFFYNNQQVDVKRKVDVNFHEVPLPNALEELFEGTAVNFKITGRQIILFKDALAVDLNDSPPSEVINDATQNSVIFIVTGKVTSETGESMPGVNIVVKGTTQGTTTNSDGLYSLEVTDGTETLVFSFIGYETNEISIAGRSKIDHMLTPDIQSLQEVVVVGYTAQKKADITGAVGVVDTKELSKVTATTVTEALQGRVAGVRVRSSGLPGQTSLIEIRGTTSVRGTKPIFVIDGLITEETRDFNPNDVESIQVLKDAAATAIYGARGANGVVLITTKKGVKGPLKVDFEMKGGIQNISKRLDLMETEEWSNTINMAYDNAGKPRIPLADVPPDINTNWQDAFIQRGNIQNYNLALSSGSDFGTSRISLDYFKNEGTIIGTSFERYTTRLTSGFKKGRFNFQQTVLVALSKSENISGDQANSGNVFSSTIGMFPIIPVLDPNQQTGYGIGTPDAPTLATNPVGQQNVFDITNESFRLQGSAFAEYHFFDFLSYKINVGIDYNVNFFRDFRKAGQLFYSQEESRSSLTEDRNRNQNILLEHTLNFARSFGKHNVNAVLGYTEQKNTFSNTNAFGKNYPQNSSGQYFAILGNTAEAAGVGGAMGNWGFRSVLARAEYDYAGKYLATASFRRDGSSRFSPSNRYGNFPAFSVGWRISSEPFFEGATPIINDLKIRASYGVTGDFNALGNYEYTTFVTSGLSRYILGTSQQVAPGSIQRSLAADNLKWQENVSTNIGLDVGMLDNKLQLNANYFISKSEDLLLRAPLIWALGNAGESPFINVGSIENRGIELGLTYSSKVGDVRYSVGANITQLRNTFLELGTGNPELPGGGFSRSVEGEPIGQFYVLKTDGIWQSVEEIEASGMKNVYGNPIEPGQQRFVDIDGDSIINADDRSFLGSPWPKLEYSFNATVSYKGFDFSMFWNGITGVTIYNQQRAGMWNTSDNGNFETGLTPWTPENKSQTTPRAKNGEPLYAQSDRFLEDGSFLRLNNVQVAYNLSPGILKKLGNMRSARVYVTGQNLLTFTNYSGLDPDIKNTDPLSRGFDNNAFPNVRTMMVGVQIGL